MSQNQKNVWLLIFSLAIPLLVGFIGSLFTTPSISTWYALLIKPDFNPPNWLFGPVWTTLFILMGIALFLVLKAGRGSKNYSKALVVFGLQLVLNLLWSLIFFTLRSPFWALIEILILWWVILLNIYYFKAIKKTAAWLLVPYILWVSVATVLNFAIWRLN